MSTVLYDRVVAFADLLATLTVPPGRSRDERAVYDAWRAALKPRAPGMVRSIERIADPGQWEFDEDREPVLLRPAAWTVVVREMAALYTELGGALRQHEHVRIVWKPKTRFGIQRLPARAPASGSAKDRAKLRATERGVLEKARKAKVKAARDLLASIVKRLDVTRATLRASMVEVRHLAAALQVAEETRLDARVRRLAEGEREREKAEDLLLDMTKARLRAERFRAERLAGYGTLLRAWLRPRSKLLRLLYGD